MFHASMIDVAQPASWPLHVTGNEPSLHVAPPEPPPPEELELELLVSPPLLPGAGHFGVHRGSSLQTQPAFGTQNPASFCWIR